MIFFIRGPNPAKTPPRFWFLRPPIPLHQHSVFLTPFPPVGPPFSFDAPHMSSFPKPGLRLQHTLSDKPTPLDPLELTFLQSPFLAEFRPLCRPLLPLRVFFFFSAKILSPPLSHDKNPLWHRNYPRHHVNPGPLGRWWLFFNMLRLVPGKTPPPLVPSNPPAPADVFSGSLGFTVFTSPAPHRKPPPTFFTYSLQGNPIFPRLHMDLSRAVFFSPPSLDPVVFPP